MATKIKVTDLLELKNEAGFRRKILMNGPRFHTWLTVYKPGEKDEMHCHNADQTFYCIEGECTIHYPDDLPHVLKPGMLALFPGGSFYQLENTGDGNLVMLGSRALSNEASMKIDYETRKDLQEGTKGTPPKATKILI